MQQITLAQIEELLSQVDDKTKAKIDKLIEPELNKIWSPLPGPQTDAFTTKADIILYGGAAGGGKTDLALGLAHEKHTRSLIVRRESTQVVGIEDRAEELFGEIWRYNGQKSIGKFPNGKSIRLGGMPQSKDWRKYAGQPYDFMVFDEAGEFTVEQVFSLVAWNRTVDPNQHCQILLCSNPPRGGDGEWMIDEFAPWLDPLSDNPAEPGELRWAIRIKGVTTWVDGPDPVDIDGEQFTPKSRTFIPARVSDNPYLEDTEYKSTLQSLPEPLRSQLLYGDFLAGKEDHEWQVIPTEWIDKAVARWRNRSLDKVKMKAVGVDVAGGGSAKTVIAPLYENNTFGTLVKREGVDAKDGAETSTHIIKVVRDGAAIGIDMTGGWGGGAYTHLTTNMQNRNTYKVIFSNGSDKRCKDNIFPMFNLRAELYWKLREALDPESGENIALPPDKRLRAQLISQRYELRPKQNETAIKIEDKEAIEKRLGSSVDEADAVAIAWYCRSFKARQSIRRSSGRRQSAWVS